jgi:hypothetical protein
LERYGIKGVRVVASSTRAVVQDCAEAESNTDARDKFFMSVAGAVMGFCESFFANAVLQGCCS